MSSASWCWTVIFNECVKWINEQNCCFFNKKNIRGNMDFRFKVCIFCVKPLLICSTLPSSLCNVRWYNVRWYIDLSNYSSCLLLLLFFIYICSCLWFSFLWSNCANMWSLNTIVQTTSNPSSIAVIHGDWWYLGSQNMLFEERESPQRTHNYATSKNS